jgi:hypothetical protein
VAEKRLQPNAVPTDATSKALWRAKEWGCHCKKRVHVVRNPLPSSSLSALPSQKVLEGDVSHRMTYHDRRDASIARTKGLELLRQLAEVAVSVFQLMQRQPPIIWHGDQVLVCVSSLLQALD